MRQAMAAGRAIGATVAGVVVAGVTIAVVEAVGHAGGGGNVAFGAAVVGYGLGSLTGSFAVARIADRRTSVALPVILAGLAAVNLAAFPHPGWFVPAALVALGAGWFVGSGVAKHRRRRSA